MKHYMSATVFYDSINNLHINNTFRFYIEMSAPKFINNRLKILFSYPYLTTNTLQLRSGTPNPFRPAYYVNDLRGECKTYLDNDGIEDVKLVFKDHKVSITLPYDINTITANINKNNN